MIEFESFPGNVISEGKEKIIRWLNRLAESHGKNVKRLIYYFIDNREIREINRKYLNHDYDTDIITFDYSDDRYISGEIFLSLEQVFLQAKEYQVDNKEELLRVMAHGVLHLIGFNDTTEEERAIMRREEEKALNLHPQKFEN